MNKQICIFSLVSLQSSSATISSDVAHIQHLLCCGLATQHAAPGGGTHHSKLWGATEFVTTSCLLQLSPSAWHECAARHHVTGIAMAPPPQATHLAAVLASFLRTTGELHASAGCAIMHAVARSVRSGPPSNPTATPPPEHPWHTPLGKATWAAETLHQVLTATPPSATRDAAVEACFAAISPLTSTALGACTWNSPADAQAAATLLAPWVAYLPSLQGGASATIAAQASTSADEAPPEEEDDGGWGGFLADSAAARGTDTTQTEGSELSSLPSEWQSVFRAAVAGVSTLLRSVPHEVPWREAAPVVLLVQEIGLHGPTQAKFVRGALAPALSVSLGTAAGAAEGGAGGAASAADLPLRLVQGLLRCAGGGEDMFVPLHELVDMFSAASPSETVPPDMDAHAAVHADLKRARFAAALLKQLAGLSAEGVSRGAIVHGSQSAGESEARSLQGRVTGMAAGWRRCGAALAAHCKAQLQQADAAQQSSATPSMREKGELDSDSDSEAEHETQVEHRQADIAGGAAAADTRGEESSRKCRQRERLMVEQTLEMVAAVSTAVGGAHKSAKRLASAFASKGGKGGNKAD